MHNRHRSISGWSNKKKKKYSSKKRSAAPPANSSRYLPSVVYGSEYTWEYDYYFSQATSEKIHALAEQIFGHSHYILVSDLPF